MDVERGGGGGESVASFFVCYLLLLQKADFTNYDSVYVQHSRESLISRITTVVVPIMGGAQLSERITIGESHQYLLYCSLVEERQCANIPYEA